MNSPILLDSGVLTLNKNGVLEPESSRMQNPFKTHMLVDEIRFGTNLITGSTGIAEPPFLTVRAEIKLGGLPLTRGYVPVGNLGKVILEGTSQTGDTAPGPIWLRSTWKFPKPLLVRPEELLMVRMMYDGRYGSTSSTTNASVTFACRSLPSTFKPPKTTRVPWATHFDIPLLGVTSGASGTTISTASELVNPFDEALRVQRFIGRTLRNGGSLALTELGGSEGDAAPTTMTMVRAIDSFGNILVRDPTPFTHLFHFADRAWTVNSVLSPKGFYTFEVNREYTVSPGFAVSFAHAISMIGDREVCS